MRRASLPQPALGRVHPRWGAIGAAAGLVLATLVATPAPALAWDAPVTDPLTGGFASPRSLQVLTDGTVQFLGRTTDRTDQIRLARMAPFGPAVRLAPAFPASFGDDRFAGYSLTQPDASGTVLVVRTSSPSQVVSLAPGASPATATAVEGPFITAIDTSPSGAAAAIVGSGSQGGVATRSAGATASWGAAVMLDRVGADRSYGVGITRDTDGGIFVVYRTEQDSAAWQAYAPPGDPFGTPQPLAVAKADLGSMSYTQSANGRGLLVWTRTATTGPAVAKSVMIATRAPGGLLGVPDAAVELPAASDHVLAGSGAAIADDGRVYLGYADAERVSPCPGNIDLARTSYLATRTPGAQRWTRTRFPGGWRTYTDVVGLTVQGRHAAVALRTITKHKARCVTENPSSVLQVRTGTSGAFGPTRTIVSEHVDQSENSSEIIRVNGFATNASGVTAALVSVPVAAGVQQARLYVDTTSFGAPGTATLKKKPQAKKGTLTVNVSCLRAGSADTARCSSKVAVKADLGKKVTKVGAARVSLAPGGRTKARVTLSKKARQVLAAKGKLKATVTIKLQKGTATRTITKRITVRR